MSEGAKQATESEQRREPEQTQELEQSTKLGQEPDQPTEPESEKKPPFTAEDGIILPGCYAIFHALSYVSVFAIIRMVSRFFWAKKNHCTYDEASDTKKWNEDNGQFRPLTFKHNFSEVWALCNLILSVLAGAFGYLIDCVPLQVILLIYAIERTVELFVYQVNVLLFDPITGGSSYAIKSATRMVILLVMNMIEYTFWFSYIYSALAILIGGSDETGFVFVLESFNMITNMTSPGDLPVVHFQLLAFVETLVGMFMNLVCLARFIGLLPQVKTMNDN